MTTPPPSRRWPGVLFAFLAPGFGHFRAGMWLRGVLWFAGICGMELVFIATFMLAALPAWVGLMAAVLLAGLVIAMLCDSFRPGRMTWKLWVLLAVLLVFRFFFANARERLISTHVVATGSMEPTLKGRGINRDQTPDYIVVDRLSHRINGLKRGDIIAFSCAGIGTFDESTIFIFRLVGMPGERVEIKDYAVYIDGRRLTEADGIPPVAYHPRWHPGEDFQEEAEAYVVAPGTWFVLGDNSPNAFDSRYWGGVSATNVIGTVSKIYYPFNRMGRVQ